MKNIITSRLLYCAIFVAVFVVVSPEFARAHDVNAVEDAAPSILHQISDFLTSSWNKAGDQNTAAVATASAPNVKNQKQSDFSIELDMPDYQPEYLRHPQKFFSGRDIKIVKRVGSEKKSVSLSEVILKPGATLKKTLQSQNNVTLKSKIKKGSLVATIPPETSTGEFIINFYDDNKQVSLPIEIIGSDLNKVLPPNRQPRPQSIGAKISTTRLGCEYCFWELSSGTNPLDENYGYVVGGGGGDYLLHTTDGWVSSITDHIDKIVTPPFLRYRGDPYLTFDADGKFSLLSLFTEGNPELITGGIYKEKTSKSDPLQLSQTIVKSAPTSMPAGIWLVFDYAKLSVDTSPTSPYKGNMYVFANAVLADDGARTGQGQYVIDTDGKITEKFGDYGIAVTATSVGPRGEVYGVRPEGNGVSPEQVTGYYISRSFDGGKTFSSKLIAPHAFQSRCSPKLSTQSKRSAPYYTGPDIAVDIKTGRIYVAWAEPTACIPDEDFEYSQYGYDWNIYVSYSDNGGDTWSIPIEVDDDFSQGDQSFPSISMDDAGNVYVAFIDHRNDKNKSQFDIYLSKSTDNGETFSQNLRLNDISVPLVNGGMRSIGDYLRMVSAGEKNIYVAYPCVAQGNTTGSNPSDACVSVVSKSSWNPPPGRLPLPSQCEHFPPDVVLSSYPSVALAGDKGWPSMMSVRISNQDYVGCGVSDFNIISTSPSSWQFKLYSTEDITLPPGARGYKNVSFAVPDNISSGNYTLGIEVANKTSGLKKIVSVPIQVVSPLKISGITPTSGPAGTVVTIMGTGFTSSKNLVFIRKKTGVGHWSGSQTIPSVDGGIIYNIPSTMTACVNPDCAKTYIIPTPDGMYTISVSANNSNDYTDFYVGTPPVYLNPLLNVITATSSPSMWLEYNDRERERDRTKKEEEVALVANFAVDLKAGSEDQRVGKQGYFRIRATNGTHTVWPVDVTNSKPSNVEEDTNSSMYIIRAGTTARFKVEARFNPKIMFAGAYRASLDGVSVQNDTNGWTYLQAPTNQTKPVVIVGEVSPYINSIAPATISSNQTVTISGVRFADSGNIISLINTSSWTETATITAGSKDNGQTIQFVPNVPIGDYLVSILHPTTGRSNSIWISVKAPVADPTISFKNSPLYPPKNIRVETFGSALGGFIPTPSNEPVSVKGMKFKINISGSGGSPNDLQDIKLFDGNKPISNGTIESDYITFPEFTLPAGQDKTYAIRATLGPAFKAKQTLQLSANFYKDDAVFTGTQTGTIFSVSKSGLTLSKMTVMVASPTTPTPVTPTPVPPTPVPTPTPPAEPPVPASAPPPPPTTNQTSVTNTTPVTSSGPAVISTPPPVVVPAPTATLTVEGQKSYTYNITDTTHYAWSSTNADTFSSYFTSNDLAKCSAGVWAANNAKGIVSNVITSNWAGCVWTVTYTVKNSKTGQSASDSVTVTVSNSTTGGTTGGRNMSISVFNAFEGVYNFFGSLFK